MIVSDIAALLALPFEGDATRDITGVAPLDTAAAHHLSFVGNRKARREAQLSAAGCLLVPFDFDNAAAHTIIRAEDPRGAFAKVVWHLQPPPAPPSGIHPTAIIGADCAIAPDAVIGPYCVIGDRVTIGPASRLMPHVTIYHDVTIGARALIHSGAVLGADGFGLVFEKDHYEKFPQIGRVTLGDDVEIGAGSAVDRAALGVTSIGDGTKLDNMVHIGHNCRIGRHVVIVAQTGIAGGSVVEDYAVIGGQVGIGDNVTIQARAVIGSGAGILTGKIVRGGGQVYWGTPARPLKEYLEAQANVARLPALKRELAELKARLAALEKKAE
ncbi:MAG TPA: UDP-3-O-(3-hydroxymyristoyl)glucosamine N-acyltransferase [Paludibaculum sp.]|jgi:UDP-3-O-[3-hydroxymyristoyl] glucosamine N-acyltransferase